MADPHAGFARVRIPDPMPPVAPMVTSTASLPLAQREHERCGHRAYSRPAMPLPAHENMGVYRVPRPSGWGLACASQPASP